MKQNKKVVKRMLRYANLNYSNGMETKSNKTKTKSNDTEKSDKTEEKVAKRTLLYGNKK